MNLIQKQAKEFLNYNLDTEDLYKNFIGKVREQLSEYNKVTYKVEFILYIIQVIKIEYDDHFQGCNEKEECKYNFFYENVLFFLQEELENLENQITPLEFSNLDKGKINVVLEKMVDDINLLKMGQQITYDDMIKEFEELKDMYFLNKKNWSQIFAGKITEMVASGIISEIFSKQIVELISANYKEIISV